MDTPLISNEVLPCQSPMCTRYRSKPPAMIATMMSFRVCIRRERDSKEELFDKKGVETRG